jgi:hypothetical protein
MLNKIQSLFKVTQAYGLKGLQASVWQKFREVVLEFGIQPILLRSRIKHIYGPNQVSYEQDELLVICLVRNGELYIKSFIEHYRSLGVKHCVFMDNGSTDRTIEMLCSYDGVTVLQTDVNFVKYESTIRRYLAEKFSKNCWNLTSDIDELFDYPYSSRLSLRNFLEYLNKNAYTAVLTQMLEFFSDIPLSQVSSEVDDSLIEKYPYYDISDIDKTEYSWSLPAHPEIKMHWGGIRKALFGTYSGLTKAALVKMDGKIRTFVGWHHVKNAKVADISCLLKHYTFLSLLYRRAEELHEKLPDFHGKIWQKLNSNPDLNPKLDTAKRLAASEELIDNNFLVVSEQYLKWVKDHTFVDS